MDRDLIHEQAAVVREARRSLAETVAAMVPGNQAGRTGDGSLRSALPTF